MEQLEVFGISEQFPSGRACVRRTSCLGVDLKETTIQSRTRIAGAILASAIAIITLAGCAPDTSHEAVAERFVSAGINGSSMDGLVSPDSTGADELAAELHSGYPTCHTGEVKSTSPTSVTVELVCPDGEPGKTSIDLRIQFGDDGLIAKAIG